MTTPHVEVFTDPEQSKAEKSGKPGSQTDSGDRVLGKETVSTVP